MATKDQNYDSPEYNVRKVAGGVVTGASGRFAFSAYQAMLVKSIQASVVTAGTAADALISHKISGTVTTTVILGTNTAGVGNLGNFTSTFTLAQGDVLQIQKGADATAVYAVGVELQAPPFATVTA